MRKEDLTYAAQILHAQGRGPGATVEQTAYWLALALGRAAGPGGTLPNVYDFCNIPLDLRGAPVDLAKFEER